MIALENVVKSYPNGVGAINGISLHIKRGEFVFIVGDTGSGKSTLIKLLLKELEPTEGRVRVNGVNLARMRKRMIPKYRRKIGCVFQDFRLIDHMTVYDNVAFAMRVVGASGKSIRKRVPYMLSLVGLQHKAKHYPTELSGGERQRVGLARALVNNPEMIIADEPTGNIDPALSFEIVDLLNEINRRGTTVLMVTHEHSLVKHFHKRIIQIHSGQIVADTNDMADSYEPPEEFAARQEAQMQADADYGEYDNVEERYEEPPRSTEFVGPPQGELEVMSYADEYADQARERFNAEPTLLEMLEEEGDYEDEPPLDIDEAEDLPPQVLKGRDRR